jgi:predicted nucleic acid-binding protein
VALVVLDASVIIGFLDPEDALHDACVAALSERQDDKLVIPASVYAEILVAPYRTGAEAVAKVDAFLADFAIKVEPITATMARAAAQLRSSCKSLRIPDALVLASADEIGADVVLSGDESWKKTSRRVTIVRARSV